MHSQQELACHYAAVRLPSTKAAFQHDYMTQQSGSTKFSTICRAALHKKDSKLLQDVHLMALHAWQAAAQTASSRHTVLGSPSLAERSQPPQHHLPCLCTMICYCFPTGAVQHGTSQCSASACSHCSTSCTSCHTLRILPQEVRGGG